MMKRLYLYEDIPTEEGKKRARELYTEADTLDFLSEELTDFLGETLKQKGYEVHDLEIAYSLSYCQGDGVSFTGTVSKDGKDYFVRRSNSRYSHEYTMDITTDDEDGSEIDAPEEVIADFREACVITEGYGYDEIEYQNSDEVISELLQGNEYTFTAEGEIIDSDKDDTPRGKIDSLREWEKTLSDKERDAIARSVKSIEKQLSTLAGNK